jgi:tetratricopeptide (TPR) repeat protein
MYEMLLGVALYEAAIAEAREDAARREQRKPEEVEVDLSAINFDRSLAHLQKAVAGDAGLWRAAYYAGRIYRAREKSHEAAELFSRAIAAQPRQRGPYIALAELYRRWDYTDEAILVAQQGTQTGLAGGDVSDLWFVLGMAYDDKRHDREAVEAFSKAIEVRRDNLKAQFQRGQTYFRMRDYANAKRDLTDFVKAAGPSFEFQKQESARMLMDIAADAVAH